MNTFQVIDKEFPLLVSLPNNKAGIYFLFYGTELVYIGKASNIRQRLIEHLDPEKERYQPSLDCSKITKINYFYCKHNKAAGFEKALIKKFKPRLNHAFNKKHFSPTESYCYMCGKRHAPNSEEHEKLQKALAKEIAEKMFD